MGFFHVTGIILKRRIRHLELWLAIVLIVAALAVGAAVGFVVYRKVLDAKKKQDEATIESA